MTIFARVLCVNVSAGGDQQTHARAKVPPRRNDQQLVELVLRLLCERNSAQKTTNNNNNNNINSVQVLRGLEALRALQHCA